MKDQEVWNLLPAKIYATEVVICVMAQWLLWIQELKKKYTAFI